MAAGRLLSIETYITAEVQKISIVEMEGDRLTATRRGAWALHGRQRPRSPTGRRYNKRGPAWSRQTAHSLAVGCVRRHSRIAPSAPAEKPTRGLLPKVAADTPP